MEGIGILQQTLNYFAGIGKRKCFTREDACILKTLLALAAIDGDFSKKEISRFRDMAETCRGYNGESFAKLWDEALHSAGYLALQAGLLSQDELVQAFVREAEKGFVDEIALEYQVDIERAFSRLKTMAMADGEYSDVERACIKALYKRVSEAREEAMKFRYSRAATVTGIPVAN